MYTGLSVFIHNKCRKSFFKIRQFKFKNPPKFENSLDTLNATVTS